MMARLRERTEEAKKTQPKPTPPPSQKPEANCTDRFPPTFQNSTQSHFVLCSQGHYWYDNIISLFLESVIPWLKGLTPRVSTDKDVEAAGKFHAE